MVDKETAKEYPYLCRQCQAINHEPEMGSIEEVAQVRDIDSDSKVDKVSVQFGETKDNLSQEKIDKLESSDQYRFNEKIYWKCGVCKHKHLFPEEGQFNRI
jgi:hypothetical protein